MVKIILVDPTGMNFPKSWKNFDTVALSFFMLLTPSPTFCPQPSPPIHLYPLSFMPASWKILHLDAKASLRTGSQCQAGSVEPGLRPVFPELQFRDLIPIRLFLPIHSAASDKWSWAYLTKTRGVTSKSAVVKKSMRDESTTLSGSLNYGRCLHLIITTDLIGSSLSSLKFFLQLNGHDRIPRCRHLEIQEKIPKDLLSSERCLNTFLLIIVIFCQWIDSLGNISTYVKQTRRFSAGRESPSVFHGSLPGPLGEAERHMFVVGDLAARSCSADGQDVLVQELENK